MLNKLKVVSSISILITLFSFLGAQHFVPAYLSVSDNPFSSMNINLTSALLDGAELEAGDEIGIFDGDVCVGSRILGVDGVGYNGQLPISSSNILDIIASAQDPDWDETGGFTEGNDILFRIWDASTDIETINVESSCMTGCEFANLGLGYNSILGTSCEVGGQVTCSDGTCAASAGECSDSISGCTDSTACNYNDAATVDDGSCAENDACDVCDGPGDIYECGCYDIPEGACDCNGTAPVCGVCDGSIVEDACGVCGGTETDPDNCMAIDDEWILTDDYSISNIYPNPFNPVTNISYGIPENTHVIMEIFDLSGKHIQSLVNEFQTQGYYSVNWNASSQSSGVYIVKMIAGETINTKKLILIK